MTQFSRLLSQEPELWYDLRNDSLGFTIDFPKEPNHSKHLVNTELGKLWMNMYQIDCSDDEKSDNVYYAVNYTEFADTFDYENLNLDDFYRNSINGMIGNLHANLLQETIIDFKGYQCREIRVDFREGLAVITAKLILVRNKYYMIMVITDTKKDFNKQIGRFLNSFDLISTVANKG
jgi:hypothetical protein